MGGSFGECTGRAESMFKREDCRIQPPLRHRALDPGDRSLSSSSRFRHPLCRRHKRRDEILATMFALAILIKMRHGASFTYDYGMGKFETLTRIATGAVMFISIALIFFSAIHRLIVPEALRPPAPISPSPLSSSLPLSIPGSGRKLPDLANRSFAHHGNPVASPCGQNRLPISRSLSRLSSPLPLSGTHGLSLSTRGSPLSSSASF